jgi:hypothetical protein
MNTRKGLRIKISILENIFEENNVRVKESKGNQNQMASFSVIDKDRLQRKIMI